MGAFVKSQGLTNFPHLWAWKAQRGFFSLLAFFAAIFPRWQFSCTPDESEEGIELH
jgi:hypothetical protein